MSEERFTHAPVSVGPIALYREPFFRLNHDIRIPIKKALVEVLAEYELPEEEAEYYARPKRPGYSSGCREFGAQFYGMSETWRSRGVVYAFRVSYPVPFVVLVTQINVTGRYFTQEPDGRSYEEFYDFNISIPDESTTLEAAASECACATDKEIYDPEFGELVEAEISRNSSEVARPSSPCPYRLEGRNLFFNSTKCIRLSPSEAGCMELLLAPPRRVKFVQHKEKFPNYSQHFSKIKAKLRKAHAPDHIATSGNRGKGTDEGAEYLIDPP